MIKKLSFNLFLLCSLVIFNACSTSNDKEIKAVEELSVKVKLLKSTFETVNMEDVNNAIRTYKTNSERVKKYYQNDTIVYDFAHTLSLYKGIKKTGKNTSENYETNKENIELLIIQLDKLKTDIENNSIPQDSIQGYIDFETQNVTKLGDDIGTFVTNCEYILELHDTYAEKVRGFTVAFK